MVKCKNYWTFEKCQEEALKYTNKTDFIKNCHYVYEVSLKNNWISDFFI